MGLVLYEREEPIALLREAAHSAVAGDGRVVVIRGEAGIGKTSLVRAFLVESEMSHLIGRCDDASAPMLLGPFREMFDHAGMPFGPGDFEDPRARVGELIQTADCIVVEDLHWADEATLDLVTHLGRRVDRGSPLFVLTMRPSDDAHLARCLAQMPGDHLVDISLRPLSRSAVAAMAAASGRSGGDVYRLSKGNPFLAAEILAAPDTGVPARVAHSTLSRLGAHSDEARSMAMLLSVFPAGTTWTTLERLRPDALEAVEELERGSWLEATPERVGFRHELLRLAVEESLSEARRRRLNQEALEALSETGTDSSALSHHAERAGDSRLFLEHSIVAAREYARAGAHRDALSQLLRAEPYSSLLPDVEQARFAEALGVELMIADRAAEAHVALNDAFDGWERLGDQAAKARVLAEMSTSKWRQGDVEGSVADLVDALRLLDGTDDRELLVRTRANMAQLVGMLSRWPEALSQAEMAMPDAIAVGGEPLAIVHGVRGNARRILGDVEKGRADHQEAIDLAVHEGKEAVAVTSLMNRVAASLGTLDLEDIDKEIDEALSYAQETQAGYARVRIEGHRGHLLELRGQWDRAMEVCSRIVEEGGEPVALIRPLTVHGSIRVRSGDESGVELIRQALEAATVTRDIQRLGHVVTALAEMQWLGKTLADSGILGAAELAETGGHVRYAAELTLWCRRLGIDGPEPPSKGPMPLLAELDGDWEVAASSWEEIGLPYYRILTLAFTEDAEAMREAVVGATALGALTTADRIRARLRQLGHRVSRGPSRASLSNPGGLTDRQIEIVRLLGEGLSNPEIARRLFIAVKTVEHHVSAILARLGLGDRQSAGEWAVANGLAGEGEAQT